MSLKVNQWANNRIHCFFKIMPNLGVFSTLYFWGGHRLLRLGTEAIHAVPDD